jgi:hypothetical protein
MMAKISSLGRAALPCTDSVVDSTTPPDTITIATTVTYNGSNSPLPCPVPPGITPDTLPSEPSPPVKGWIRPSPRDG